MEFEIDHQSPVPLHVQAENLLRNLIEQEEYINGDLLIPKEVELSRQLGISRNTLRQAINTLVYEGLLVRRKGYGTKVTNKKVLSEVNNWRSFSQEMKTLGIEVHNFELHLIWETASKEITDFFEVKPETRLLWLKRLRGKKDFPFVYFASAFSPRIGLTGNEDFTRPLYDILENDYSILVRRSHEEISAVPADGMLASKLAVAVGAPILVRKRFVYDVNELPVEYSIGFFRGDSFKYTIECFR